MSSEYGRRSDQFDIRLNISETDPYNHAHRIVAKCDKLFKAGSVRYIHVSGIEIGDVPGRSSFGKKHVHIALTLNNYTSKQSILRKFVEKDYGWYIEPRDKSKSMHGWISYHSKARTKIDPDDTLLLQRGTLPRVREPKPVEEQSARQKQKYEQWKRRQFLMTSQQWDQLDVEFPGFIWTSAGQNMKREIMKQSNDQFTRPLQGNLENYIIWGPSGTGKSSSVALLYPNCYKKQKGSQYWDGYDKTNPDHAVVWIDEMSLETLATLTGKVDGGFEFLKELADRYPVTVDEKYTKGYKIRPKKVIITMNEHPTSLLPDRAVEVNKQALYRKFKIMHVNGKYHSVIRLRIMTSLDWLALNGLECTNKGCRRINEQELDSILEFDDDVRQHSNTPEIDGERAFNLSRRPKEDTCPRS